MYRLWWSFLCSVNFRVVIANPPCATQNLKRVSPKQHGMHVMYFQANTNAIQIHRDGSFKDNISVHASDHFWRIPEKQRFLEIRDALRPDEVEPYVIRHCADKETEVFCGAGEAAGKCETDRSMEDLCSYTCRFCFVGSAYQQIQSWRMYDEFGNPVSWNDLELKWNKQKSCDEEGHKKGTCTDEVPTACEEVFVFENGVFRWPPVQKGFERIISVPSSTAGETEQRVLKTISLQPLIFQVDSLLTDREIEALKTHASDSMFASIVTSVDEDPGHKKHSNRESEQAWVGSSNPTIATFRQRLLNMSRVPRSFAEPSLQVVRYNRGGRYNAHHDYFPPRGITEDHGDLFNLVVKRRSNRYATILIYLNTLQNKSTVHSEKEIGGGTNFPYSDNNKIEHWDGSDCSIGQTVYPRKGTAILFYSLHSDGRVDYRSKHTGCPVNANVEKWIANQWIWNNKF